jgi:hypothetical protein
LYYTAVEEIVHARLLRETTYDGTRLRRTPLMLSYDLRRERERRRREANRKLVETNLGLIAALRQLRLPYKGGMIVSFAPKTTQSHTGSHLTAV